MEFVRGAAAGLLAALALAAGASAEEAPKRGGTLTYDVAEPNRWPLAIHASEMLGWTRRSWRGERALRVYCTSRFASRSRRR